MIHFAWWCIPVNDKYEGSKYMTYIKYSVNFFFLFLSAFALKCYTCIGTEETCSKNTLKSDPDMLVECPSQSDRCMRIAASRDGNNSVSNTCANQQSCNLTQTVCDRLESDLDYCKVDCCTTDGCNAGPDRRFQALQGFWYYKIVRSFQSLVITQLKR